MIWNPCFPLGLTASFLTVGFGAVKLSYKFKYLFGFASAIVLLDQGSKYLAISLLEGKEPISLLEDCLRFLLAENRGGFLSLGASLPEGLRNAVFLLFSSVFLLIFCIFMLRDKASTLSMLVASSMIVGGGVGNLIDRAFRDGAVIDFVNVGIGSLRTGIFNVADMAVLFGCILLFIPLIRSSLQHNPEKNNNTEE
jgi:signal peptidase II